MLSMTRRPPKGRRMGREQMRLLITGGAGFIGSNFVRLLLTGCVPGHEDTRITVLDALTYAGDAESLPARHPRLEFVHGDIGDVSLLWELLPGHDAVVHFAAESHVDRSIELPELFATTNILGTHRLLAACVQAGVRKVVQVSTDEVYGSITQGSWAEPTALAPNTPYAASKAAGDLLARAYWRTYGLDVSITRCSNNYGPRQHPEKVIPKFVTRLLDGRNVTLHGDGGAVREWLHVEDHCRAVCLVLDKGQAGEVYHVGGGVELSNRELTARLLALCGADWSRVDLVPDRAVQDRRYSLDSGKIGRELGFEPAVDFAAGLEAVVQWYRDHRAWWEPRVECATY
jgi:dTDP-glucose 4,6-dehydratase